MLGSALWATVPAGQGRVAHEPEPSGIHYSKSVDIAWHTRSRRPSDADASARAPARRREQRARRLGRAATTVDPLRPNRRRPRPPAGRQLSGSRARRVAWAEPSDTSGLLYWRPRPLSGQGRLAHEPEPSGDSSSPSSRYQLQPPLALSLSPRGQVPGRYFTE